MRARVLGAIGDGRLKPRMAVGGLHDQKRLSGSRWQLSGAAKAARANYGADPQGAAATGEDVADGDRPDVDGDDRTGAADGVLPQG